MLKVEGYLNTACSISSYSIEQALLLLAHNKHDIKASLLKTKRFLPAPTEWSDEDRILFEQAYNYHGKNFYKIKQCVSERIGSEAINFSLFFVGYFVCFLSSCLIRLRQVLWASITCGKRIGNTWVSSISSSRQTRPVWVRVACPMDKAANPMWSTLFCLTCTTRMSWTIRPLTNRTQMKATWTMPTLMFATYYQLKFFLLEFNTFIFLDAEQDLLQLWHDNKWHTVNA